jgi:PhnB protein
MTFYKECLGGELTFKTIGESPLCNDMPAKMKASILHASLKKDELIIIASDMVDEIGP